MSTQHMCMFRYVFVVLLPQSIYVDYTGWLHMPATAPELVQGCSHKSEHMKLQELTSNKYILTIFGYVQQNMWTYSNVSCDLHGY